jgi:hypothetical protein
MLPGFGQQRQSAPLTARSEMPLTMVRVVAGDDRRVDHFFQGVLARLAGLDLHEIEHLALAVEQKIVESEEDAGPSSKAQPRPLPLGDPHAANGDSDVVGRAPWYVSKHLASERGVYGDSVPPNLSRRALPGQLA